MPNNFRHLVLRGAAFGAALGALTSAMPAVAQNYPVPPASIPQAPNQPAPYQQPQYQQSPYQQAPSQSPAGQPALNPARTNPICVRLEGQLASFDQGTADPGRAQQIQQAEAAITKQQADIDRTTAQAHKSGCAGTGFFALFSALSPQCGPITSQIQQMRGDLDRMMSDLERLKSGNSDQADQRRALIGQLAQNNCGAQYTAAANAPRRTAGLFRRAVWRRHHRQSERRRRAERHLPHRLRADLRRLLFPDLLFDASDPLCRGRKGLPARMPSAPIARCIRTAIRARAWIRRFRRPASSIPRCRALIGIVRSLFQAVPAVRRARAGKTRSRTPMIVHARERRYRRHRSERKSAVAAAEGRRQNGGDGVAERARRRDGGCRYSGKAQGPGTGCRTTLPGRSRN